MASKTSNATVVALLAMRIAGLQKYGASLGIQVLINGQSFTIAQLVAIYQACVVDRSTVASARGALRVTLQQQKSDDAARVSVDQGLKAAVVGKFGAKSQEASDFGYIDKEPKKATVKVKAQAVEQTALTRKARHIMGKVQRSEIKAPVTAQAESEPAAPGAPVPTKS